MDDDPKPRHSHGCCSYPHSFSPALMKTLEAMVDTFIPSLPLHDSPPAALPSPSPSSSSSSALPASESESESESESAAAPGDDESLWKSSHDELQSFYHLSASQNGVPSYAAGLICSKLNSDLVMLVKLVLWLLSTRMGTFLLCGKASLCWKRPRKDRWRGYGFPASARTFAEIPLKERERILLEVWSHSEKETLRRLFNAFKIFSCFCYFTKLNKQGRNPAWSAIGYCGPDPAAMEQRHGAAGKPSSKRPLDGAVLDAELLKERLAAELEEAGFEVLEDVQHLEELWKKSKNGGGGRRRAVKKVGVKCDAVVVGSGAGGGVVAAVLAQAGHKVLVLEKGKYLARDDLSLLEGPAMDAMYEGGGILATDDSNVLVLAGSTVGGGTAINWGASLATPPDVLREWARSHGLAMFDPDGRDGRAYADAMRTVLARLGVSSPAMNGGGAEAAAAAAAESLQNSVLRKGCRALGFHVADIPSNTAGREHRCGWCGFGCWSGTKQSTAETWLVDAAATGNARIVTGMSATSVLHRPRQRQRRRADDDGHEEDGAADADAGDDDAADDDDDDDEEEEEDDDSDGGRPVAVGVVAASVAAGPWELLLFVESRVTVVSAGALSTPFLLQRSGLRNPNIGRHLRLHPVHLVWGYFPGNAAGAAGAAAAYEGPIMSAMSAELAERHGVILQCPAVHPGMFSVLAPWESARDFRQRMRRFARTANVFALARDGGRGGCVGAHPLLGHRTVRYELDARDEEGLAEGAAAALRVLLAAGAAEVGTHHRRGDRLAAAAANDENDDAVERFLAKVRSRGLGRLGAPLCSAHQMGSCRMGARPRSSAVKPSGETWDVARLFVADASVLPTALGVNPMVTIQSVSYCIAHEALRALAPASSPRPRPRPPGH